MTRRNSSKPIKNTMNPLLTFAMILGLFTGASFANDIDLVMQGTNATILKGNTITRTLNGMPVGIPGAIKLKLKWHADVPQPFPLFNSLKIQVRHGNSVVKTTTCYSMHSKKAPLCDMTIPVSKTEANKLQAWQLVATNNSEWNVVGFNIAKGNDINPLVPNFKSVYAPSCPSEVKLDMEGTTLSLAKGGKQLRKIYGIGNAEGVLKLKAKWHTVNIIPTVGSLRIELLKPNGQVAKSGTYYSIHSKNSPKLDFTHNISAADASLPGVWQLRITNSSNFEIEGFNIERESRETSILVPSFYSSYKAACRF